ncbi:MULTISPECIES: NifB/NifX family molybdenum-iron cluster-binding protein [Oceanospirillaceae]|uniref:NifB/NifX family molybdenum-iron cluster-binding protein n=1 Tax=Oceanobacter antarcticus TaxID=3133425 RepID=A0ABW8NGD0_9GAMM|tara:strand:+ start:774 stop:1253 length:480 start_codon:yes stop_codon:yes gene_type:complete
MSELTSVACVADVEADPQAVLVAFASMDGDMVDQHFGSAQAFYLFAVSADSAELLASQEFGHEKKDGNEDKLKPKLAWLVGADVVYCGSIGGSATRQLIALGVNPIKVSGGPDVEELIEDIQKQMNGTPEFWLAKILKDKSQNKTDSRFDDMDDEGWDG